MPNNEKPVKIVVVSSDPLMVDLLESVLDPRQHVIETASPTSEGIAHTRKGNPDLYLVDELDSDMDVLNICEKIRQYSGMPILVLTASKKPGIVEQVLNAGADECLIKPIPRSVLVAHLNTLARRARAEKDAALSIVRGEGENCGQLGLLAY